MSTERIGELLRRLREEQNMLLREVATKVGCDVAILSKVERGERRLNREMLEKLAKLYKYDKDELLVLFLSEKALYTIGENKIALRALDAAAQYIRNKDTSHETD